MPSPATAQVRHRFLVTGRVQGVGFRPFVSHLARRHGLGGRVVNTPDGVVIEAEGTAPALDAFRAALLAEAPPGACIDTISASSVRPEGDRSFRVAPAAALGGAPTLAPDLATCADCLAEIRDPAARRYRYPFTACSACGPRWSVVTALPWQREHTTLVGFPLCLACRAEFTDPRDRRFHAESMACPACGPRLCLRDRQGNELAMGDAALRQAGSALQRGAIVALKGLGGFQLLVDAGNAQAVAALRRRKQRPEKPLAVMVPDASWLDALARVTSDERVLLMSPEAPIVLVERRHASPLAAAVAPGLTRLGLMLPTTPLHHLLLDAFARPVVCTSGNHSGEPLCLDGDEAVARLGTMADLFLDHDRPIARPVDDSVFQLAAGQPQCLRLARGYAPARVAVSDGCVDLALGGQLKAAPALALSRQVVLGAHVGDLDSEIGLARLQGEAAALCRLAGVSPGRIACDQHPDYASTRLADAWGLPVIAVQHHHAHAAACLAEHGARGPALALIWDGAGYGDDGTLWGGEILLIGGVGDGIMDDPEACRRLGALRPFRLPGGEAAIREPRRSLLGLRHAQLDGEPTTLAAGPLRSLFSAAEWRILTAALARGVNAPWTTSVGRLFDAVAALAGLRMAAGYEGQAAMVLQQAAEAWGDVEASPGLVLKPGMGLWQADWAPLVASLFEAHSQGKPAGYLAARLHAALAEWAVAAARAAEIETVVLGGGCFQNRLLLRLCVDRLRRAGFRPLWPRRIPPNDGGLALGQLVVARGAQATARSAEKGD